MLIFHCDWLCCKIKTSRVITCRSNNSAISYALWWGHYKIFHISSLLIAGSLASFKCFQYTLAWPYDYLKLGFKPWTYPRCSSSFNAPLLNIWRLCSSYFHINYNVISLIVYIVIFIVQVVRVFTNFDDITRPLSSCDLNISIITYWAESNLIQKSAVWIYK